jgi:hypothetical protein
MNKPLFARYAWLVICGFAFTGAASGQGSQPKRGVLLTPQRGTLLQHDGGCTVAMLNLRITTGKDDLRGGKNNLDVEIHFANGDMQPVSNVNKGANWGNNSVNTVGIHLNHPVAPGEIKQIRLVHSAQAGYNGPSGGQIANSASPISGPVLAPINAMGGIQSEDNWDMAQFQAFGLGSGIDLPIASFGAHRFTGSKPSLDINTQPAGCPSPDQVKKILFTFMTADDDLRGGNDNLDVTVLFTDGTSQTEPNINHSSNWPNGSTKGGEILLNHPVTIDQIRGFTLETTFTGGSGGDNWKMNSMQADAVLMNGSYHTIAKSGYHRFSADWSGESAKQISIRANAIN